MYGLIESPAPSPPAIVPAERSTSLPSAPLTPMQLMQRALEAGNLELVERMMTLQDRWEATQARKAFEAAIATAQNNLPVILKQRTVNLGNGRGYRYEDFASIDRAIKPHLKDHGISYRFRSETQPDGKIKVTCILSGFGHSEENALASKPDASGSKNEVQAIGSVQTYLMRYTLKAALGLAASEDDDGRGGVQQAAPDDTGELISAEQVQTLVAALKVREMPVDRLLKWIRTAHRSHIEVKEVADIPASIFQVCLDKVRQSGEPQ